MEKILLDFSIKMRDDGAHIFNEETLKLYVEKYIKDSKLSYRDCEIKCKYREIYQIKFLKRG